MAAPHIAGVAALYLQANPSAAPYEVGCPSPAHTFSQNAARCGSLCSPTVVYASYGFTYASSLAPRPSPLPQHPSPLYRYPSPLTPYPSILTWHP